MRPDSQTALTRDQIIFTVLDEVSRRRALQPAESELMELTMHRLANKRDYWQWSAEEDAAVRALLARRCRRRRKTKPFQANAEVTALAAQLQRSFWSVQRRLERLNKGRRKRKATTVQMFKRANGHAALKSANGQQAPPVDDCAEPDSGRSNGSRAAGRVEGGRGIEEGPRGEETGKASARHQMAANR